MGNKPGSHRPSWEINVPNERLDDHGEVGMVVIATGLHKVSEGTLKKEKQLGGGVVSYTPNSNCTVFPTLRRWLLLALPDSLGLIPPTLGGFESPSSGR